MKIPGLIGGMSWESTATYYRLINETVKQALGGFHSAKCLLYSLDFAEIEACQTAGDWEHGAAILADAARRLEKAGADFIVICTNTMHKVAPQVEASIGIPLLHIAGATADELTGQGITRAALLGTKYTMTQDFYRSILEDRGIEVIIPEGDDIETINQVIYHELCLGKILPESRAQFRRIISDLAGRGAQAVILGCTEIGLLVGPDDAEIPMFDTAVIHAVRTARLAIDG